MGTTVAPTVCSVQLPLKTLWVSFSVTHSPVLRVKGQLLQCLSSTAHTAFHFFLRTTVHPSSSSGGGGGGSVLLTDGPDDSQSIAWTQKDIHYYLYSTDKQSWIMWLMVWAAELWFTKFCLITTCSSAVNLIVHPDKYRCHRMNNYCYSVHYFISTLLLLHLLNVLNAELRNRMYEQVTPPTQVSQRKQYTVCNCLVILIWISIKINDYQCKM